MTAVRLSSPTDVLEAVPVLLGFYPTESLCALYFDGSTLALTARMDLPTDDTETSLTLDSLDAMLGRYPTALLVIYSADQDEARATMRRIITHTGADKIRAAILATPPGWTTVDPDMPDAVQWTNPYPTGTGPVAAALAAQGLYAMGTRDDLAESIQAPDHHTAADYAAGRALDAVPDQANTHQLHTMAVETRDRVIAHLHQPTTILPEDAAYLAARIRFAAARDETNRLLDKTTAAALASMWQAVAGMTPDEDALPVLGCLGLAAWVAGNGALASVALERGEHLPEATGSELLRIVRQVLDRAIPPSLWDDLRKGLF